jgi:hypothetical protein
VIRKTDDKSKKTTKGKKAEGEKGTMDIKRCKREREREREGETQERDNGGEIKNKGKKEGNH